MRKILCHVSLLLLIFSCNKKDNILDNKSKDDTDFISADALPSELYDNDSLLSIMLLQDTVLKDRVSVNYYLDGVLQSSPISVLEGKFPVFTSSKNVLDSSAIIKVYCFTIEENYLLFGDENGYKFRETKLFEETVVDLAEKLNLLEVLDESELPSYFIDSVIYYHDSILILTPPPPFIFAGLMTYYDDFIPYGTQMSNPNALALALGNWNNRIGSYKTYSLYSVVHLYDKTFLRSRMGTIASWGLTNVVFVPGSFRGFLNNKTSSILHNFIL